MIIFRLLLAQAFSWKNQALKRQQPGICPAAGNDINEE